ncbi:MAG: AGE family epimerase/isomerase [Pseudomonadota bacterium]
MPSKSNVFPVIMCGGAGTRLWPASRPSRPKQFINLVGECSLFAATVERMRGIEGFRELVVVAGAAHAPWLSKELATFDINATVLLEPEGRESAAAIAAAVAHIEMIDASGVAVVVASDHHIPNADAFRADIALATQAASEGGIVTIGIQPDAPQTAYGYIRPTSANGAVVPVEAFVEKPDADTAASYIRDGYLWNSGNFIASIKTLAGAFETLAPDILTAARAGVSGGERRNGAIHLGAPFRTAPKISFDYAIMEHFSDRKVVRSTISWSDLGAWDAVRAAGEPDDNGNVTTGDTLALNSKNSHIRNATDQLVVLEGACGLNIVVEDDVVFVSTLERSQSVKTVFDTLKTQGRPQVDAPALGEDLRGLLARWERWRDTSVLPLWWSNGYDRENGLWREHLDPDTGAPTQDDIRARVQGRQAFVYAHAGNSGWAGPWHEALAAGLSATQGHHAGDDGLLRTRTSHQGQIVNDAVLLYDQTFTLLALAEASNIVPEAEQRALKLLDAIETRFGRKDGGEGFQEAGERPFQANPQMHLFEAAQHWVSRGKSERWHGLADKLAGLAVDHLIDVERGFIYEYFEADWTPSDCPAGNAVEPGHQFEWAWLMHNWSITAQRPELRHVAERLFACGAAGVDPVRKIALDTLSTTLKPTSQRGRLWPQTEWLKAACALQRTASLEEGNTQTVFYTAQVEMAARAVDSFLDTPAYGLWRDKQMTDGTFVQEMAPASSLYHIVGAISALREWQDQTAR